MMESDRKPIVGQRTGLAGLSFPSKDSSLAEKILCGLIAAALVLGIIVAILVFVVIIRVASHKAPPELCVNSDCLWEASEILSSMNTSADPCDDFYEYACGKFEDLFPTSEWSDKNFLQIIEGENIDKLRTLMMKPLTGSTAGLSKDSALNKLKTVYQSCIDEYRTTTRGAFPLTNILSYGWGPLGNARPALLKNFLTSALATLIGSYNVGPFFNVDVNKISYNGGKKNMIKITQQPRTMLWYHYYLTNSTYSAKSVASHRAYILQIVKLVQKGYGSPIRNADLLAQAAVDDIVAVETKIAAVVKANLGGFPKQYAINNIQANTSATINWYTLLNSVYNEARITQTTTIAVNGGTKYLNEILSLIDSLTPNQLNTYMYWTLIASYVEDLGWEYLHVHRAYSQERWYWVDDATAKDRCYSRVSDLMGYAVEATFVQNHFADQDLAAVKALADMVKGVAKERIDRISWLDDKTKEIAKSKVSNYPERFGYDAWLADSATVDQYYKTLYVTKDKHVENILALVKFNKHEEAQLLLSPYQPMQWPKGLTLDTGSFNLYHGYDAEGLLWPAAMLQHPIFDMMVPHYANFAGAGRYFARKYFRMIDESTGRYRDEKGTFITEGWWSSDSTQHYTDLQVANCQVNLYNETAQASLESYVAEYSAKQVLNELPALRTAFQAYRNYQSRYGKEPILPGLQMETADQAFFLSYAQTFCTSYNNEYVTSRATQTERTMLKSILKQSPEFASAFNCPKDANMAMHGTVCPGY